MIVDWIGLDWIALRVVYLSGVCIVCSVGCLYDFKKPCKISIPPLPHYTFCLLLIKHLCASLFKLIEFEELNPSLVILFMVIWNLIKAMVFDYIIQ